MDLKAVILISLIYIAAFCSVSFAINVTVECYPNKTITLNNPIPGHFINGVANDSSRICTLTYTADYSRIYITECNLDERILMSLTNRTVLDSIMGGLGSMLYTIKCNNVGTGVNRSIAHTFLPSVRHTSKAPQTYYSYAKMSFRHNNTSGQIATSSSVGEKLIWSMECAAEHFLNILNCTAYAGQSPSTNEHVGLIVNGCSQDKSLIGTDFMTSSYDIIGGEKRYYADFLVFKFMSNDYLTIGCTVKICPPDDASCAMPSCSTGRRRRDIVEAPVPLTSDDKPTFQSTTVTIRVIDTLSGVNTVRATYVLPLLVIVLTTMLTKC